MKKKLNKAGFEQIVFRCSFTDWKFLIGEEVSTFFPTYFLQVSAMGVDNGTGAPMQWKGRKWALSPHMTASEVVQTAFKAVMTAMEHETREKFLYRGRSIFDPHYDVDKLHALRGQEDCLEEREAPPA